MPRLILFNPAVYLTVALAELTASFGSHLELHMNLPRSLYSKMPETRRTRKISMRTHHSFDKPDNPKKFQG